AYQRAEVERHIVDRDSRTERIAGRHIDRRAREYKIPLQRRQIRGFGGVERQMSIEIRADGQARFDQTRVGGVVRQGGANFIEGELAVAVRILNVHEEMSVDAVAVIA